MKASSIDWSPFIPEHWDEMRLKDIARLQSGNSITADSFDDDAEYPVYGGNGLRGFVDSYTNDGDFVLIGRQGALCGNINYAHNKFFATEHAVVVYPYKKEPILWLGETLRTANLNRLSMSAAQPGLAVSTLNDQFIPYPPCIERQRIASYLDEKTAAIDKQVSLLEQKKEKYALLRKSLIKKVATEGLIQNRNTKFTGVDWIQTIPCEWKLVEIKSACKSIFAGATPSTSEVSYWDGDIPWIPSGCCQNGLIEEAPKYITKLGFNNSSTRWIPAGTTVMAMTGATCANVGQLTFDSCANQSVVAFVENKRQLFARFLFYLLLAARPYILTFQTGGAQAGVNVQDCSNLKLPLPPLSEQKAIADYLDEKCAKIDATIANIDQQIEKYKLLRRALINEVVTGQRAV